MARKTAEELALENEVFWRDVAQEEANGAGGMLPFDIVMSRRYAERSLPYMAHSEGKTVNVVTGQDVLRQAGPQVLQSNFRR